MLRIVQIIELYVSEILKAKISVTRFSTFVNHANLRTDKI